MKYIVYIVVFITLWGCGGREIKVPKPRGYFRIDLPEKAYKRFDTVCPFTFEYPVYAKVVKDTDKNTQAFWYNVEFPTMKATLHLSYIKIDNNLLKILEDCRTLVYKHTVKAEAISDSMLIDKSKNLYGLTYDIKGEAASCYQFILTDSSKSVLRGALYFNVPPNKDSLTPVMAFIKKDIHHFIKTFAWK
jgi:gliding motility-associated lipoprotein GldD